MAALDLSFDLGTPSFLPADENSLATLSGPPTLDLSFFGETGAESSSSAPMFDFSHMMSLPPPHSSQDLLPPPSLLEFSANNMGPPPFPVEKKSNNKGRKPKPVYHSSQQNLVSMPRLVASATERHEDDILISEARKVVIPTTANEAARCVLDALSLIVPQEGVLTVLDVEIPIILARLYYAGSKLRPVIQVEEEIFDAKSFVQDFMHVRCALRDRFPLPLTELEIAERLNDDKFFDLIKLRVPGEANATMDLNKIIPPPIQALKWSDMLVAWLKDEKGVLQKFAHAAAPKGWIPVRKAHAKFMRTQAMLQGLTVPDNRCPHPDDCLGCGFVRDNDVKDLSELARWIPSGAQSAARAYNNYLKRSQTDFLLRNEALVRRKRKADKQQQSDEPAKKYKCRLYENCSHEAVYVWPRCCSASGPPLGCSFHATQAFLTSPSGKVKCPEHKRSAVPELVPHSEAAKG